MAKAATQHTGLTVYNQNAADLASRGKTFDAVTLNDVLEHIPNPLSVVKSAFTLLRPGGVIAIKSPCGPNQQLKENIKLKLRSVANAEIATNMVHINHFSPKSLALALKRSGFQNIHIEAGAPELFCKADGSADWLKPSNLLRVSLFWMSRAIPRAAQTPLGLNLQAYAIKP
jgi:SAM-dependent methyltransferase